eukprot:8183594-Lingulodinium_polyedra.AAC.1
MVYTPDNHLYDEELADYATVQLLTGRQRYPPHVDQVVASSRPLERVEMLELIRRARSEAVNLEGPDVGEQALAAVDW